MNKYDVAIIGGGAAGIVAAISAKRKGASVVICEKMPQIGKKILVSGNGRCNLLNEEISSRYYKKSAYGLVESILSRFGKDDIADFFNELGLEMYSKDGRIFPITNQASSVLKTLEMELKRLSVPVELNFEAINIPEKKCGYGILSKEGRAVEADKVIITAGGRTYPALGSDGKAYELARRFGHTIIEPVPNAVPLVVKDQLCHLLQGQKIFADAKSLINGRETSEASGELLFTQYGLSGTSILDISEDISVAVNRHHCRDAVVSVDMVPYMDKEELSAELAKRIKKRQPPEDFFAGILPNKFSAALKGLASEENAGSMAENLKDRHFKVIGTRGWNEAEFTDGGVDLKGVKEGTLESKYKKGVYFAGEVLDVGGKRGGYHLAWAWASGFIAGLTG